MNVKLTDSQRVRLSEELKKLDMETKSRIYHEAEELIKKKEYSYTPSEYFYDQLFLNETSSIYIVVK